MFWEPRGRLHGTRQNMLFWLILPSFVSYYSVILVPAAIGTYWAPRGPVTGNWSKLTVLVYSSQFYMLLLTDFGSRCDPNISETL